MAGRGHFHSQCVQIVSYLSLIEKKKSRSSPEKKVILLNHFRRLLEEIPIRWLITEPRCSAWTPFCHADEAPDKCGRLFSIVSGKKKGFQAEDLAPGHTGTLVRRQKNRPKEKCKPSTSRRHRNEDLRARGSGSNYRVISVPQPNACGHGETWQNMHIVLLLGGSVACGPSWPIVLSEFFYCSGRNFF